MIFTYKRAFGTDTFNVLYKDYVIARDMTKEEARRFCDGDDK